MITTLVMAIILRCIQMSNHYIVHLKLNCMSVIPILKRNRERESRPKKKKVFKAILGDLIWFQANSSQLYFCLDLC